ncbi:MAG: type II secretion system protein [Candidatus Rifleibacteriota bacterium]
MTGKVLFNRKGFSLFEMLIVVAIMGILALSAVPVAELSFIKTKENQLSQALEEIRSAIRLYRVDCRTKCYIKRNIAESEFFPRDLNALVNPDPDGYGVYDRDGNHVATFTPTPYLNKIPADPFVGAPAWAMYSSSNAVVATFPYQTMSDEGGRGVFDVSVASLAPGARKGFITAINGTNYIDW